MARYRNDPVGAGYNSNQNTNQVINSIQVNAEKQARTFGQQIYLQNLRAGQNQELANVRAQAAYRQAADSIIMRAVAERASKDQAFARELQKMQFQQQLDIDKYKQLSPEEAKRKQMEYQALTPDVVSRESETYSQKKDIDAEYRRQEEKEKAWDVKTDPYSIMLKEMRVILPEKEKGMMGDTKKIDQLRREYGQDLARTIESSKDPGAIAIRKEIEKYGDPESRREDYLGAAQNVLEGKDPVAGYRRAVYQTNNPDLYQDVPNQGKVLKTDAQKNTGWLGGVRMPDNYKPPKISEKDIAQYARGSEAPVAGQGLINGLPASLSVPQNILSGLRQEDIPGFEGKNWWTPGKDSIYAKLANNQPGGIVSDRGEYYDPTSKERLKAFKEGQSMFEGNFEGGPQTKGDYVAPEDMNRILRGESNPLPQERPPLKDRSLAEEYDKSGFFGNMARALPNVLGGSNRGRMPRDEGEPPFNPQLGDFGSSLRNVQIGGDRPTSLLGNTSQGFGVPQGLVDFFSHFKAPPAEGAMERPPMNQPTDASYLDPGQSINYDVNSQRVPWTDKINKEYWGLKEPPTQMDRQVDDSMLNATLQGSGMPQLTPEMIQQLKDEEEIKRTQAERYNNAWEPPEWSYSM